MLKKGTIRVKIVNPRVTMITDDLYEVIFTQKYKSSNLRLSTTKKMRFQKTSGGWKITFEGTN